MENAIITSDISHPSVELIEVTCSARGNFSVDKFREVLIPWALKYNVPAIRFNGPGVALKRAMAELASGPDRELKTTGRKGMAVYSLIALDLSRVDREESDGTNVGQAEVSARIYVEPGSDSFTVKITPEDHPAAALIRSQYDTHCGLYSATYDVKTWLTQQVFPAMQAIRSVDAMGKYWFHADDHTRAALLELRDCFKQVSGSGGNLNLYMTGRSGNDASIVDLLTDAIIEEAERVSSVIEDHLMQHDSGDRKLGSRGLQTQMGSVEDLYKRLNKLGDSLGISLTDVNNQLNELKKRLALVQLSIESNV